MSQPNTRLRTYLDHEIGERTTPVLTLTLVDEAQQPIPSLATLTLLIHCHGTVIRPRASILSSFADGQVEIRLAEEDTRILGTGRSETHTALVEWTWNAPNGAGWHEIIYTVANNAMIPAA